MAEAFSAAMSRRAALARVRAILAAAGVDTPALDARLLLLHALAIDARDLLQVPEAPVGEGGASRLTAVAARRAAREPVARILGQQEFWGLPLRISPATLIPRADTETVVEAVLAARADVDAPLRILDLGTGSGAILLALLRERPRAWGLGVDRSAEAAATARENAAALGLAGRACFAVGDWAASVGGRFDIVVSNPPYVESAVVARLQPEVARHDPRIALDGGIDGLEAYRAIGAAVARLLVPNGIAAIEVGAGQSGAVAGILRDAGLASIRTRADLAGIARVLVAERR